MFAQLVDERTPDLAIGFHRLTKHPAHPLGEGCQMLKIIVLICAVSTDRAACDLTTAVDVITTARATTPQQCGFMGQAILAPTSIAPEPGKQYTKIMCVRDRVASAAR